MPEQVQHAALRFRHRFGGDPVLLLVVILFAIVAKMRHVEVLIGYERLHRHPFMHDFVGRLDYGLHAAETDQAQSLRHRRTGHERAVNIPSGKLVLSIETLHMATSAHVRWMHTNVAQLHPTGNDSLLVER